VDPLTRPCNLIFYRDLLQKSDMLNGFVEKNEESPWKQVFSRDRVKNFRDLVRRQGSQGTLYRGLLEGYCKETFCKYFLMRSFSNRLQRSFDGDLEKKPCRLSCSVLHCLETPSHFWGLLGSFGVSRCVFVTVIESCIG
jgi:hypothetical protein